jgi:hypothetical protein
VRKSIVPVRYRSFPVVGRLSGPDAMERAAVRAQGIENAAIVGSVGVRRPKSGGSLFVRDQPLDCSVPLETITPEPRNRSSAQRTDLVKNL